MEKVRDRLWLWGHAAGASNREWNLPRPSRITPLEAAAYLDISNLLMVLYDGQPEMPYDQYYVPLRALDRVGWSIVGARGERPAGMLEHILDLARREPNLTGLVMDDFLNWDSGQPEVSVEELARLAAQRRLPGKTLDLMMILYAHQLDAPVAEHLRHCNQVSFWIWESKNLVHLERDFARFEQLVPDHERYLGVYMWDFGAGGAPIADLSLLQRQCELGLAWLHAGRIHGMIFLPSTVCDLELDTVEWVRGWIREVGGQELGR